jgi:hypothetical protein
MLEAWDEVPLALQLMDGSNPLYGYIGMDDYTLHPVIRPGAFVRIDPRQKKFLPSIGVAMTVQSSSSNSVSVTCAPGAKCTMFG